MKHLIISAILSFLFVIATFALFSAHATTSIVPEATGANVTFDMCKDSVTGNIRPCTYLLDPATALPFSPFQAGQNIGNTSFGVTPGTSGGLTPATFPISGSGDNHTNIKATAGQVYHISVSNNSATLVYLRLYNAGSGFNGCASATNLLYQFGVPANTSGSGYVEDISMGLGGFTTGISMCLTAGYANTDTTAPPANAIIVNIGYK